MSGALAGQIVDLLTKQVAEFDAWKLVMRKNNSIENYDELIAHHIESNMLDKNFQENAEYLVWGVEEDPTLEIA